MANHRSASEVGSILTATSQRQQNGRGRGPRGGKGTPTQDPVGNLVPRPGGDGMPGSRARPLPPGEYNYVGVNGPLDVRGRCWKCLRAAHHKAKDCSQPHAEYNPGNHMEAIQKLSHGLIVCP